MKKNTKHYALRNYVLVALTVAISLSLSAFEWAYIWMTNHAEVAILGLSLPLALVESIIISATGLLALVAGFVAADRRLDPRPEHRASAGAAQIMAVLMLLPGISKAADSFAFPGQIAHAAAYRASDQYQTDLANSRSTTLDSMVVREAAEAIGAGTTPTSANFDFGAWVLAAFLYGANMAAATFLWSAKPETPAERKRRLLAERRAETRAERWRERMAQRAAEKQIRPSWFKGLWAFGKRAA